MNMIKLFGTVLALTVLASGLNGCATVNSSEVGIKTSLGVVKPEPLAPGVHFLMPTVDEIDTLSIQQIAKPEEFSALTKDSQLVTVTATASLQIRPEKAVIAFVKVGRTEDDIFNRQVQPALLAGVKAIVSKYDQNTIIANQTAISDEIAEQVKKELAGKGDYVELLGVDVTGFRLDEQVQQSIEAKQIAKQELERKQIELQTAAIESQRLKALQSSLTPEILLNKAIDKWNGSSLVPPGASASGLNFIAPSIPSSK